MNVCEIEQIIIGWAKKNRLNVQIGAINELMNALDLPAENAEVGRTIVQQLKAEIAALANELQYIDVKDCDVANCDDIIKRMRQLSAV
jgi:hypothetical protein